MGNLVFILILAGVFALTGLVVTRINLEHERRLDRSRRKSDHAGLYGGADNNGGGAGGGGYDYGGGDFGGGDFGGGGGDGGGGGE